MARKNARFEALPNQPFDEGDEVTIRISPGSQGRSDRGPASESQARSVQRESGRSTAQQPK
jgi:hypothetical protein